MFKGWAILPAGRCLFNKTKVTVAEIAEYWKDGTIVVLQQQGKIKFVAGASGHYAYNGSQVECYHDQTGVQMGWFTVINQIHFKTASDGTIKYTNSNMGELIPAATLQKAPLAVFK